MNDFIQFNFKVSKDSEEKLTTKFTKDDLKSTNDKNNIIIIVQLNRTFYNLDINTSPI